MLKSLVIVFNLLFNLACFINAKQRAPPITCQEDSFKITQGIQPIVNEVDVTFFYKINLADNININSAVDFRDYVDECLDYVFISARTKGEIQSTVLERFKIPRETSLQNSITIQIFNLTPLTTYQFQFGYEQKKPNYKMTYGSPIEVNTCFGEPSKVKDVSKKLNGVDGSITIEWKQSDVIKAPFICYYLIEKRVGTITERIESKQFSYKLTRNEVVNKAEIRISAYNDPKCYNMLDGCPNKVQSSGVDVLKFDASLLPVTTRNPNNSLMLKSDRVLSICVCFILFLVF